MVVVGLSVRDNAIGGCENLELAHVGIVRGEEDADVARDARQNHATDPERLELRVERRIEEAGMLGLQHEVIARGRFQPL